MEDKVQLKLHVEDLNDHTYNDDYWFHTVNLSNFDILITNLQTVIDYHHDDLDWDETPTIEIVKQRIKFGSTCHLWMYKDTCLGWHWTNDKFITKDWVTPYKQLKPNQLYIGGAFISKKAKPSASSSYYLYRQGFEYSFNFHNSKIMYLYSDNWNRASAQLCYRCGFSEFNFL
jgi:hypothetical protein